VATVEERQEPMGNVGGDVTGAEVEAAGNVVVGKGNRQTVHGAHMDDDNRQQVVNVGSDRAHYQQQSDRDQLRMEQKMDQVLYRLDNIDRRVQQIELAMQFGGGKTSQTEKLLMLLVGGAALMTLALNLYAQVVLR
jgi:hypothetical protein